MNTLYLTSLPVRPMIKTQPGGLENKFICANYPEFLIQEMKKTHTIYNHTHKTRTPPS